MAGEVLLKIQLQLIDEVYQGSFFEGCTSFG
jgi:hypothetical protein